MKSFPPSTGSSSIRMPSAGPSANGSMALDGGRSAAARWSCQNRLRKRSGDDPARKSSSGAQCSVGGGISITRNSESTAAWRPSPKARVWSSEEHTTEITHLMRVSDDIYGLEKQNQ